MTLIDELIKSKYLKTPKIINAFQKIQRKDFLKDEDILKAEINSPISIGRGQTISQPLTVAFMLELLQPQKNEKILDIGSGSGWTCALLAKIVGEHGRVFGIERIEELKNFAEINIKKYNFISKGIVQLFCSDGYRGLPDQAPFDKIIIAAAAEEIPKELLKQLKIGGRIVLPIGKKFSSQDIVAIDKVAENNYKEKKFPGFIFVPFVKE